MGERNYCLVALFISLVRGFVKFFAELPKIERKIELNKVCDSAPD